MENVRVRFAPSPTGGLHIGGIRTALFNYLFAKKTGGVFILRIEDTDQSRYVDGAENYIKQSLEWAGLVPDEDPWSGGEYAPYRQSERKDTYKQYADKLLASGHAYYAFDTLTELDEMREKLKATKTVNQQYNSVTRLTMKNSLTLSEEDVSSRIDSGDPYVIRLKINPKDEIRIQDMVRGWVKVQASTLDDKVIMKSDGLPTYHLANVVDDHLMKITHVIRGEEWLPSAPTHVLLYKFLGWEESMPQFAHLPLILKPDGNGKLSKRAADKLGFPIFPLNWEDQESKELSQGFKEAGFLPDSLINFLSFLGWNPGSEQELFSMEELIQAFSIEKVNKAGTKFDLDKLRWYNQQYLKRTSNKQLAQDYMQAVNEKGHSCTPAMADRIIDLFKERVTFSHEIPEASGFLFAQPTSFNEKVIRKRLNDNSIEGLNLFVIALLSAETQDAEGLKSLYSDTLNAAEINPGSVMQLLRVVISGQAGGPDLMEIISIMGSKQAANRILSSLKRIENDKG